MLKVPNRALGLPESHKLEGLCLLNEGSSGSCERRSMGKIRFTAVFVVARIEDDVIRWLATSDPFLLAFREDAKFDLVCT